MRRFCFEANLIYQQKHILNKHFDEFTESLANRFEQ